jgi:hypothetical protein
MLKNPLADALAGYILPLPCDTLVACQVHSQALICHRRYLLLAHHTDNLHDASSGSCTVSLAYVLRRHQSSNKLNTYRLPPAFNDIPTDADYAMELISQRVASGLDIKPSALKKPKKPKPQNVETGGDVSIKSQTEQKPIDWKKWGDRAALGKAWADDGKRLLTGSEV